jgi:hypothetical protein
MKEKNMLRLFVVLFGVVGFCQSSFAHNDLIGTWKLTSNECLSGVPSKGFGGGLTGSFGGTATFTETQLFANLEVSYKMDKAKADEQRKQFQDALAQLSNLPDSPEKQKSIADINKYKAMIDQMEAGVQCSVKGVQSYSINGSTIHTDTIKSTSTCPGSENDTTPKSSDSTFEIKGNTLRVISEKIIENDSNSCPKGDRTVAVLTRVN